MNRIEKYYCDCAESSVALKVKTKNTFTETLIDVDKVCVYCEHYAVLNYPLIHTKAGSVKSFKEKSCTLK